MGDGAAFSKANVVEVEGRHFWLGPRAANFEDPPLLTGLYGGPMVSSLLEVREGLNKSITFFSLAFVSQIIE